MPNPSRSMLSAPTVDGASPRRRPPRTSALRASPRGRSLLAGVLLTAGALAGPAAAAANDAGFKATVPFSGGRSTDLRVGEPLGLLYKGETITKVCWSPAPIQHAACGKSFAAAAVAGKQKLSVTLKGGVVRHETLTIGAPATKLASSAAAGSAAARVVEYRATCTAKAYDTYSGGKLRGNNGGVEIHSGDEVGAFYRAGKHAVLAMPYHTSKTRFFSDACLTPVN